MQEPASWHPRHDGQPKSSSSSFCGQSPNGWGQLQEKGSPPSPFPFCSPFHISFLPPQPLPLPDPPLGHPRPRWFVVVRCLFFAATFTSQPPDDKGRGIEERRKKKRKRPLWMERRKKEKTLDRWTSLLSFLPSFPPSFLPPSLHPTPPLSPSLCLDLVSPDRRRRPLKDAPSSSSSSGHRLRADRSIVVLVVVVPPSACSLHGARDSAQANCQ